VENVVLLIGVNEMLPVTSTFYEYFDVGNISRGDLNTIPVLTGEPCENMCSKKHNFPMGVNAMLSLFAKCFVRFQQKCIK
jgi:hypothetical protein